MRKVRKVGRPKAPKPRRRVRNAEDEDDDDKPEPIDGAETDQDKEDAV